MVKNTKKNNIQKNLNKNKKSKKICYKGYMSKKSGIHKEKEFFTPLNI